MVSSGRHWSVIQCLLYFCLCLIPCWFDFAGYGKVTNKPLPPNMNTKEISRSWFTYKLVVLQWIWIWKRYPGHGKLYLADIDPWFSGGHGPRQVMHPTVSQQTHQKYKYKCKNTKKQIQKYKNTNKGRICTRWSANEDWSWNIQNKNYKLIFFWSRLHCKRFPKLC